MGGFLSQIANPQVAKGILSDAYMQDKSDEELQLLYEEYFFLNRSWNFAEKVHLNTHHQLLTFDDKVYLIPIYRDIASEILVKKSVQCGISEMLICRAFAYAEHGYSVLYVLPKHDLRGKFVYNRIDPLFVLVPEYRRLLKEAVGDSNNVGLKHIGKSTINFVGSNSESEFIEYPADLVIVDELDRCNQENLGLAKDRLGASELKHQVKVSTPTYADYGIDAEFQETDGKEWYIQCEYCNQWQSLDWYINVVVEKSSVYELLSADYSVLCNKCKKPLNRLAQGEWVAQYPNRDISGYHISKLFSPQTSIAELWSTFQKAQANQTLMRMFHNSDLGIAYSAEGDRLSRAMLNTCVGNYRMLSKPKEKKCYMGIDVGEPLLHITIMEGSDIIFIGTRTMFKECSVLMKQYNVKMCVIDARPETRKAKEFQSEYRGKVMLCEYIDNDATRRDVNVIKGGKEIVQSHRTQSIDGMVAKILQREMRLPINTPDDFYKQITTPVRVLEDTSKGPEARWRKGQDHYFHSLNYCNIAKSVCKPLLASF